MYLDIYKYKCTYIYIYLFMVAPGSHFLVNGFGCIYVNIYIRRFNSIEPLLAPGLCTASLAPPPPPSSVLLRVG